MKYLYGRGQGSQASLPQEELDLTQGDPRAIAQGVSAAEAKRLKHTRGIARLFGAIDPNYCILMMLIRSTRRLPAPGYLACFP